MTTQSLGAVPVVGIGTRARKGVPGRVRKELALNTLAKRIVSLVAGPMLWLGLPSIIHADIMTGSLTVTGNGGTGAVVSISGDNATIIKAHTNITDPLVVTFQATNQGFYTITENIFNASTTLTWSDFHYALTTAPEGSEFSFAGLGGVFDTMINSGTNIDLSGGAGVPPLTSYTTSVAINVSGPGQVTFTEIPTIPEPSSFIPFGLGSFGLLGYIYIRYHRKQATCWRKEASMPKRWVSF